MVLSDGRSRSSPAAPTYTPSTTVLPGPQPAAIGPVTCRSSAPRSTLLVLLTDQIPVGAPNAAVVVGAVGAGSAVSSGSYGCGTDRRSAIRIPSAPSSTTIGCTTMRPATIGHATARNANSTPTDTCRANSSA